MGYRVSPIGKIKIFDTRYPIPDTRFMDSDLTPVGMYNFRNQRKTFGIKVDDRRRHIYVVGKTGVGKSTLLENMIIADVRAGKGVGVVDPHGELAEKILDFVPEERLDDVIYFDPSDMEYPIAFNPMEQVGNEFRHLVASGIMGVFKKIWPDAWSARMEYILNNTLLALLELPDATLLGILRMFAEPEYRKKIVENLKDPVIKAFWQNEFARYSQKLETEALAAIQNKVGQFVSNPLIRNILGQPRSALNMRQIMDTGKIFIVNLSKGKIGEDNSALLGAMIITRLNLAAMSRVDVPERDRRDFYLYVDEFQNFATDSFASILSEARKYHLSLTLAHQYIGQLTTSDSTKVRDAIFGNVGHHHHVPRGRGRRRVFGEGVHAGIPADGSREPREGEHLHQAHDRRHRVPAIFGGNDPAAGNALEFLPRRDHQEFAAEIRNAARGRGVADRRRVAGKKRHCHRGKD